MSDGGWDEGVADDVSPGAGCAGFSSDMMRVLHVISSLDPGTGGPTTALHGLTRAQVKAGLSVSVVATAVGDEADKPAERLRTSGVNVRIIKPCSGRLVRHPELSATVAEMVAQADLVHIHALWEEIQHQAARHARKASIPYLIRPCGMLDPWSLGQNRWVKRLYMAWRLRNNLNHARAIHFTSQTEYDLTEPLQLRAPAIIEPNGVDLAEFETLPPSGAFRSRHPQLASKRIVLFLSRLHHKKGLELLLPAFAALERTDTMLVLAGPDSDGYRARLEQMVQSLGLSDRVLFTGMLMGRDRIEALADAELFVLPSYQENFGISVVEALAAGCPVLISDQVNIHREVVEAGVGGAVPIAIEAIRDGLRRWLDDDVLRTEASRKARPFVWQHYDWKQIALRWSDHYRRMLMP